MAKTQVRLTLDRELVEEAKMLGLDLRRILELALRKRVAALRALDGIEDMETG